MPLNFQTIIGLQFVFYNLPFVYFCDSSAKVLKINDIHEQICRFSSFCSPSWPYFVHPVGHISFTQLAIFRSPSWPKYAFQGYDTSSLVPCGVVLSALRIIPKASRTPLQHPKIALQQAHNGLVGFCWIIGGRVSIALNICFLRSCWKLLDFSHLKSCSCFCFSVTLQQQTKKYRHENKTSSFRSNAHSNAFRESNLSFC